MYSADLNASSDFGSALLPSQYNEMVRRSANMSGEQRLLWAVLEDAIRSWLANRKCATRQQRIAFHNVRRWFEAPEGSQSGLFGFQTICDLLEIDSARLIAGLHTMQAGALPIRRQHRVPRSRKLRRIAA